MVAQTDSGIYFLCRFGDWWWSAVGVRPAIFLYRSIRFIELLIGHLVDTHIVGFMCKAVVQVGMTRNTPCDEVPDTIRIRRLVLGRFGEEELDSDDVSPRVHVGGSR